MPQTLLRAFWRTVLRGEVRVVTGPKARQSFAWRVQTTLNHGGTYRGSVGGPHPAHPLEVGVSKVSARAQYARKILQRAEAAVDSQAWVTEASESRRAHVRTCRRHAPCRPLPGGVGPVSVS